MWFHAYVFYVHCWTICICLIKLEHCTIVRMLFFFFFGKVLVDEKQQNIIEETHIWLAWCNTKLGLARKVAKICIVNEKIIEKWICRKVAIISHIIFLKILYSVVGHLKSVLETLFYYGDLMVPLHMYFSLKSLGPTRWKWNLPSGSILLVYNIESVMDSEIVPVLVLLC